MWFAIAAHERLGWPLEVVLDEAGWISHAWVRRPDGRTLDVAGLDGAEDFILTPADVMGVDVEQLLALTQGPRNEEMIQDAQRVLDSMGLVAPSRSVKRSFSS